jgi:hypothetical protein
MPYESNRRRKSSLGNTVTGLGMGALAGLPFGNPVLGLAVGAGVGASGVGEKLKLPFFKKDESLFQGGSKDISGGNRTLSNAAAGAGWGALIGAATGNVGRGAGIGAIAGALGVGRGIFPGIQGGSRRRTELAKLGRGNVFNEARRERLFAKRSKSRSRLSPSKSRVYRSRSRSRSRSVSRSRSRSPSRSRSRSRSRSSSMESAFRLGRAPSKYSSKSPMRQTSKDMEMEKIRNDFYLQNPDYNPM